MATYSDHSVKDVTTLVDWVADLPTIAEVKSSGVFTCHGLGDSQITAMIGTMTALRLVSCHGVFSDLQVTPTTVSSSVGSVQRIGVTAIDLKGNVVDVTSLVSWSGLPPGVTITEAGTLTCNSPAATIGTASYFGVATTLKIDCVPPSWHSPSYFLEQSSEFAGPFPSWVNVKIAFGAAGDGLHDDTQALQRAFDSLKTTASSTVLWFPAGIYLIQSPLTLTHKQGFSIVGEDPRTTIIRWTGSQSESMLQTDGSSGFKISRLSFDGAGIADTAETITTSPTNPGGYYSTFNEISDQHIQGTKVGIRLTVDAETSVNRVFFDHLPTYGLQVGNFNTLNIFITDSLFTGCGIGVTNWNGAGNFIVSNSFFQNSTTADMSIGNTGYFTARHNTSIDSAAFFIAGPIGQNAAQITLQNNTILDPGTTPFQLGNEGPLMLLDNVVRMQDPTLPIVLAYNDPSAPKSVFSFGNTFTSEFSAQTQGASTFQGNVQSYDDVIVAPGSIPDVVAPATVYTPSNSSHAIFEVPAGSTGADIQGQIDAALRTGGPDSIVHIPTGVYPLAKGLHIPSGTALQIVGDGPYATVLVWNGNANGAAVELDRNSASLKDLRVIMGTGSPADGIRLRIDDQPTTHVMVDQARLQEESGSLLSDYSVNFDGIDHANVELFSTYTVGTITGVNIKGGPFRASGRGALGITNFYNGSMQSTANATSFAVSAGGKFLVQDNWHDGGSTSPRNFILSGSGTVTEQSGEVAINSLQPFEIGDFDGKVTLIGLAFSGGFNLHTGPHRTQLFNLGLEGTSATYLPQPQSGLQVHNVLDMYYAGGAKPILPSDMPDSKWLRSMLAQTRSEYATARLPLAQGASRNRLERIIATGFSSAVHVVPARETYARAYIISMDGIPLANDWKAASCNAASWARSTRSHWILQEAGDGDYRLQQADGRLVLGMIEVKGGTVPELKSSNGGYDERWSILPVGNGESLIRNRASNLLLAWTPGECPRLINDTAAVSSQWSLEVQ